MNIFGLGPMEILLIVVLALIVFGPARLPEIMGQVGRAIADFRRATSSLSDEFNRTIQAEIQETRSIVDETKSAVTGAHASLNAAISGTPAATATTPAPALTAAAAAAPTPSYTNGTNGTSSNGAAQEQPPLASTAQWSWETAAPTPPKPAADAAAPEPPAASEPPRAPRKTPRRDDLVPPY